MNQPLLVTATQKAGPKITIAVGGVILALLIALPLLSLLSPDNALHVSAYTLTLVGKILCYAIVALALDLVWGYAGLLSLGHGLFFALGGVALSQIGNVGPDLGQSYIIDSFLVVVLGGVGQLAGSVLAAFGLGIANKILEPQIGAVLGKILILALIILFIQKRPQGLFALKGRVID